jgi:hypothetical protein
MNLKEIMVILIMIHQKGLKEKDHVNIETKDIEIY